MFQVSENGVIVVSNALKDSQVKPAFTHPQRLSDLHLSSTDNIGAIIAPFWADNRENTSKVGDVVLFIIMHT